MASSGLRSVLVRSTKMPSNFLSSSTLSGIDREVIFADCLQVTAIAGVADQRLVALGELPLQRGEDRGAIGGILLRLLMVAADNVTAPGQHHRLGREIGLLAALAHRERHERRRIVEHQFAHQLVAAFAHAEDIAGPCCSRAGPASARRRPRSTGWW